MMERFGRVRGILLVALFCGTARADQPDVGIPVFPPDNPWNWDISGHGVHPNSGSYIASIGSAAVLRADYSFEINTVPGTQLPVPIGFTTYPGESDPGPGFNVLGVGSATGSYPFPPGARIEGGGDAHCLVVDTDNRMLYETYVTSGGPPWSAACGAVFDLKSNALRPEGWTSGDAAGLPIFPGLLRYEEIVSGKIDHALRVTVPTTQYAHLFPARHDAGSGGANDPPLGLRLRLKRDYDLSGFSGTARIVLDAVKKYGLIVADQGSAWYISSTVDSRWPGTLNSTTTGMGKIKGSDMEAVLTVDASGNPIPPSAALLGGGGGGGGGGGCGATGWEALVFLGVLLLVTRSARP